MNNLTCRKLRFYIKDDNKEDLIDYQEGTAIAARPIVYVYEHTGTEEEAMAAFMPIGSFGVVEIGDSTRATTYLAFPLKGISKVKKAGRKLLYRVENGKVSRLESVCKICKDRIKNTLSGCTFCDSLKKVPQLYPSRIIKIKSRTEEVDHDGDRRSDATKEADREKRNREDKASQ